MLTLWNVCSRNAAMERHVVEQGVCARLLDIMNRSSWPHSLRDVAGGCLEFFSERFSNLTQFPDIPLPHELDWPLPVRSLSLSQGSSWERIVQGVRRQRWKQGYSKCFSRSGRLASPTSISTSAIHFLPQVPDPNPTRSFPLIPAPALAPPFFVQKPPTQGLVPAIAAYINLINSKIPLLEYRGSHGIARACYAFPYGCAVSAGVRSSPKHTWRVTCNV